MAESSDKPKVSDFIVERLRDWGVDRIYGYSGDGINGLLGALARADNHPEFIQAPHEELCAFMACAHAKYTRRIGVCLVTQGPGAIHILNGLYDAKLDHQPLVAIVGQVPRTAHGSYYQQEIDLPALFKDVAGDYVQVISSAEQAAHVVDRAFRTALAKRTVTCVIVPHDVQELEAVPEPKHEHGTVHSSIGYTAPHVIPDDAQLRAAAEVLNQGERVALLVGAGAIDATSEVIAVAECLGAGIAKALLGKPAVPDDVPFVTGSAGWLGTRASNEMLAECDTLLIVGSQFPYTEFLPAPGKARAVQIDVAGESLGLRYPTEVNLVGDSKQTLARLLPLLKAKPSKAWRNSIEQKTQLFWREAEEFANRPAKPLNPAKVFWELSRRLPDDVMLACDCGTTTFWYGQLLKLRKGMLASLSSTLATMGAALPYAITAKLNHPERPAVALVGDGAMQMNGISSLLTVAQRYRSWKDPRLVVLVLNNRDLSYVTWEQRVMEGNPKFIPSQALPDFPYARYAELIGLRGLRIDSPDQVAGAWDAAFRADRPLVIEAITDPNVPPLPPELTPKQKTKLEKALAQDPEGPEALAQLRARRTL